MSNPWEHSRASLDDASRALLELGEELRAADYSFVSVTPASHRRVNARPANARATSVTDVFGWSRPFRRADIPPRIAALLADAGELEPAGDLFRSRVRFSSLGDLLFVHSAFPTEAADSVFFGPDTYRFARAVRTALPHRGGEPARLVDLGCGSGAGGLFAASLLPSGCEPEVLLVDINPKALRFAGVNARLNGITNALCRESDLFGTVRGTADFIISNPPYLVDPLARAYRHGGGAWGFALSLRIVEESLPRLAPGGRFLLYTGAPVVNGRDILLEALSPILDRAGFSYQYEEVDPDVFGEELDRPPYDRADRIAVVALTVDAAGDQEFAS